LVEPTIKPATTADQWLSLAPLLIIVMLIVNNRQVMGERVNGPVLNVLGWGTTAIIFAAAIVLVWTAIFHRPRLY
jgi:Mn2+/Fe2+ NRAMP family transporter